MKNEPDHSDFIGYDLIVSEIAERSRVLDLGCGEGDLLDLLVKQKRIEGYGVEISQSGVSECVKKGLFVSHGDIDDGLSMYPDNSFDYVILNQTLQNTKKPQYVMQEIMRIGKNAIISFPNFVYISIRMQMMFKGAMPTTRALPYAWYESPNIHLLSIRDFKKYCNLNCYPLKKELHFTQTRNGHSRISRFFPNLFAEYGFFILDGSSYTCKK